MAGRIDLVWREFAIEEGERRVPESAHRRMRRLAARRARGLRE